MGASHVGDLVTLKLRVTEKEHKRLRVRAAHAGKSMVALFREFIAGLPEDAPAAARPARAELEPANRGADAQGR